MVTIEGYVERKDKRIEFFNTHRKVISDIVQKAHGVKLMPEAITIASGHDIFSGEFFDSCALNSCAYIAKVDKDELAFYRTIYKQSNKIIDKDSAPLKIDTKFKNKYFKQYCDQVLAVYSTFYEEVNIVWITAGKIEGDVSSLFSKFITPSYTISDSYVKFICKKPRYDSFDRLPYFYKLDQLNFIDNESDDFMDIFFNKFNKHLIPDDPELKLNKEMDINTLIDKLTLISMCMI